MRFILVDEILEMDPGRSIRAVKRIGKNEEFFQDHFPGFPVVPGVLLTEMMAQAAGKCLDAERATRGKAMLARIETANFRKWVKPNDKALIYAEITINRSRYAKASCHIEVGNDKICSAELFFSFIPSDEFAADYYDEVLENYMRKVR